MSCFFWKKIYGLSLLIIAFGGAMGAEKVDARLVFTNEKPTLVSFDTEKQGAFVVDVQDDFNDIDLKFGQSIDARIRFNRVMNKFKINRNVDFDGNQLLDFRAENQADAPICDETVDGRIYYNTTADNLLFCNGTTSVWENSLEQVYEDSTPQLGGDLDVNDQAIVSDSGNLLLDNTNPTGATSVQLGTDTDTTNFQVLNDTGTSLFEVDGAGAVSATGTVDLTNAEVTGTKVLVFEGAVADDVETTFEITNPTGSDKTITFQDKSGTVALLSDIETISNLDDNTPTLKTISLGNGVPHSANSNILSGGTFSTFLFNKATDSSLSYSFTVPNDWIEGTDIVVDTLWAPNNSKAGDINFDMEYRSVSVGEIPSLTPARDAIGDTVFETVNANTAYYVYETNTPLPAAQFKKNDMVNLKLTRTVTGDTYLGDIYIYLVRISYQAKKYVRVSENLIQDAATSQRRFRRSATSSRANPSGKRKRRSRR